MATTSIYDQIAHHVGPLTHTSAARQEMAQWRETVPALAEVTDDLEDLKQLVTADTDAVLGALLDLHQAGSQLAGMLLLHLMLPKLRKLTSYARVHHSHCRHFADDDRRAATIASFLTVIGSYRARTKLAGALGLQTLSVSTGLRSLKSGYTVTPSAPAADELPTSDLVLNGLIDARAIGDQDDSITGTQVLDWALTREVITPAERELLARAYLVDDAVLADLAAELGMSYAGLRQRLHRLVTRIRSAVLTHASPAPQRAARPASRALCRVA
ncbi:sigma-70 family RNA polymerase sigma factor [Nocardia sp. NPDC051030]|uniref:sigma-70 family RNA polymerase sigma factor n=1 Tax=Nocardia sp. NPDC051030 TaxID=3155162 RepID=UPI003446A7A5